MSAHLTEGWPLGPTSSVYMSGQAMYPYRSEAMPDE